MKQKIVIVGGGNHAVSVADLLSRDARFELLGYTDLEKSDLGLHYLGTDQALLKNKSYSKKGVILAMGIGSKVKLRRKVYELYKDAGFKFLNYVHPSSVISPSAEFAEGVILFPQVVVGPFVKLGENVLLHDGVIVEHHTQIGEHSYLSPGVAVAGRCEIGETSFLGVHASVIEEIKLGKNLTIGAGAVVVKSFEEDGVTLVGVPAKVLVKK